MESALGGAMPFIRNGPNLMVKSLAERAGIVCLSLEGYMLGGAFGAVIGSHYAGSAWIGAVTGVGAGLMLAGIHAACTLRFRADQIVTGVAVNLFTVGITRFLLQLAFDSSSNSPRVAQRRLHLM